MGSTGAARTVAFVLRPGLRRNVRSLAALALLLGVAAGGAMGAAAGARRTTTSSERLAAVSAVPDLFALARDPASFDALLSRPGVVAGSGYTQLGLQPAAVPCSDAEESYFPIMVPNAGTPFAVPRPRLVDGRWAVPSRPGEAMVSEQHAARLGVGVGDRISYRAFVLDDEGESVDCAPEVVATVRVVGVLRELSELGAAGEPTLATTYLTPAFVQANPEVPIIGIAGSAGYIDLRAGVDPAAFAGELAQDDDGREEPAAEALVVAPGSAIDPALDTAAVGLWVLAAVLAGGGAVVLLVGLLRQAAAGGAELRQLHALGVSRAQLGAVSAGPGLVVALVGTVLAVAVAVLASRFHLVGLAARVEPDPGTDVDPWVLAAGVAGSLLLCGVASLGVAAWASGAATRPLRTGRAARPGLGDRMAARGLPPWAALGVDYAVGRPRRTELPARGALVTAVVGVAGVVATLLFGVAVRDVTERPSVYGWGDWVGYAAPADEGQLPDEAAVGVLEGDVDVIGLTRVASRFKLRIGDESLTGMVVDQLVGEGGPTIVEGRRPAGGRELALGVVVASHLDVGIGDQVEAAGPGRQRAMATVTATFAFPSLDGEGIGTAWLADRALVDRLGWRDWCNNEECYDTIAVTLRDGADQGAFRSRMARAGIAVDLPVPAPEVLLLEEADTVPTVAAAGLAVIAVIGLGHTLAVTVDRRRRELAVTRALGFERRHVRLVVHAEAAVLAVVGAVAGAVVGVVIGRAAWRQAARSIGIGTDLEVPVALVGGVAAGVLAVCLLLSVFPARAAARRPPAAALRDL